MHYFARFQPAAAVWLLRGCFNARYPAPIALDSDNTEESMLLYTIQKKTFHSLIALVVVATARTPGAPANIIFLFIIRQYHAMLAWH
jgi:hypothetical protein